MAKAKKTKITELELLRAILEKLEQIRQEISAMRSGRPARPVYYVAPRPAPARPPEWAPKVKAKPVFKPVAKITKIAKAKTKRK